MEFETLVEHVGEAVEMGGIGVIVVGLVVSLVAEISGRWPWQQAD